MRETGSPSPSSSSRAPAHPVSSGSSRCIASGNSMTVTERRPGILYIAIWDIFGHRGSRPCSELRASGTHRPASKVAFRPGRTAAVDLGMRPKRADSPHAGSSSRVVREPDGAARAARTGGVHAHQTAARRRRPHGRRPRIRLGHRERRHLDRDHGDDQDARTGTSGARWSVCAPSCARGSARSWSSSSSAPSRTRRPTEVASDTASLSGGAYKWNTGNTGAMNGKYYARVGRTTSCKADTSETVKVRR